MDEVEMRWDRFYRTKWRQTLYSRKVWAGLLGLVITLGLWWLGEIDGPQTVAALAWVLGIFIGAVAVEDGLRNMLGTFTQPTDAYRLAYNRLAHSGSVPSGATYDKAVHSSTTQDDERRERVRPERRLLESICDDC